MFQLIKASYKNVVSKCNWINWFIVIAGLELLPALLVVIYPELLTAHKSVPFQMLLIYSVVSMLGCILYGGYLFVYLRELISDYKCNFINLFKYGNDVVVSFLKYIALVILAYLAVLLVTIFTYYIPSGIAFALKSASVLHLIVLANIVFAVLLIVALLVFAGGLILNYVSKNFKFLALIDFKSAKKYFCKEYFDILIYNVAVALILQLLTQYSLKTNILILYFAVVVVGVFWVFLTVDMLAGIYYKKSPKAVQITE